jgi:hypothetical protein
MNCVVLTHPSEQPFVIGPFPNADEALEHLEAITIEAGWTGWVTGIQDPLSR